MIEDFFDHKCDIYHITEKTATQGYGLPSSIGFDYPETPDITALPCHFGVKNASVYTAQREPQNDLETRIKLTLPKNTDIRRNDKVVDCDTGLIYTAEQPRNIRDHHIFVYIKRVEKDKAL
jgi:hypothetical protein